MAYSACLAGLQFTILVICTVGGVLILIPYMEDRTWNANRASYKEEPESDFFNRATYYFSYVPCEETSDGKNGRMCPPGFDKLTQLRLDYVRDLTHPVRFNEGLRKELRSEREAYLRLERRDVTGQLVTMGLLMGIIVISTVHLVFCCIVRSFAYKHVLNIWFHTIGGLFMLIAWGLYWESLTLIRANNGEIARKAQTQAMEFYNRTLNGSYAFTNTLRAAHACSSLMSTDFEACRPMKSYVESSGMCSNERLKLFAQILLGVGAILYFLTSCIIGCLSGRPATNQCRCRNEGPPPIPTVSGVTRRPLQAYYANQLMNAGLYVPRLSFEPPPPYDSIMSTAARNLTPQPRRMTSLELGPSLPNESSRADQPIRRVPLRRLTPIPARRPFMARLATAIFASPRHPRS